jgi:hypothetical protein
MNSHDAATAICQLLAASALKVRSVLDVEDAATLSTDPLVRRMHQVLRPLVAVAARCSKS